MTGCAGAPNAERSHEAAWRLGYIAELGASVDVAEGSDGDCRESAARADAAVDRYARVTYVTRRGALQHRVVPLAADSSFARGDWVYVNTEQCVAPLARRAVQRPSDVGHAH